MGTIAELKQQIVERLLEQEDYFLIVVDPRHRDVRLPEYLTESEQPVGLSIGLRMAIPIPDLEVDENGIQGTLSFSRTPFYCFIPWAAMVQLSAGDEHLVWVIPPEAQRREQADESESEKSSGKPRLRLV
jgi:hypothetical protein